MHPYGMSVYFEITELKKQNKELKEEVKKLKKDRHNLQICNRALLRELFCESKGI